MKLIEACASAFVSGDRNRGSTRQMLERIKIQQAGQIGLLAVAQGSYDESYLVGIDFTDIDENVMGVHCDCPRFENGYFCKHLWATITKFDLLYDGISIKTNRLELFDVDPAEIEIGALLNKTGAASTASSVNSRSRTKTTQDKRSAPGWKTALQQIAAGNLQNDALLHNPVIEDAFVGAQHWFVFSVSDEDNLSGLQVALMRSTRKQNREWSRPVAIGIERSEIAQITSRSERVALSLLNPVVEHGDYFTGYYREDRSRLFTVEPTRLADTIEALQATGRLAWKLGDSRQHFEDARAVTDIEVEQAYRLTLNLTPSADNAARFCVQATLSKPEVDISIDRVIWVSDIGCALIQVGAEPESSKQNDDVGDGHPIETCLIRVAPSDAALLRGWQQAQTITVPTRSLRTVLRELGESQSELPIRIDAALGVDQLAITPTARCLLQQQEQLSTKFDATLTAVYGQWELDFESTSEWWFDEKSNAIMIRDRDTENKLLSALPAESFDLTDEGYAPSLEVAPDAFLEIVHALQSSGWEVSANGAPVRLASDFSIEVESGVDWFDLNGEVEFDGVSASLPVLLEAMRRGGKTILLDDGSQGMLPEDWLKQFAAIGESGQEVDGSIRFKRSQSLLLDMMLQEAGEVDRDRDFAKFVRKLHSFEGIKPMDAPKSFEGTLREYQKTGLGWFEFLQEFGFGGCLADDMGLGKTIQVLALLEKRRAKRTAKGETRKPSIVVVPKSLVFNWIDEANKFTPKLRLLNYTGSDRKARLADAQASRYPPHLIVTTYGTLRNDAAVLHEIEFDHVVLDEAQAIKNPRSQAAKASRLLRGQHRLAMTGTPVENHLGDLWSLFEFLNPGMLDSRITGGGCGGSRLARLDDEESRKRIQQISQSLRPFILRRTKEQVLTELPDKVEQTLACQMERPQRKLYDELREHYRVHLSNKVQELGLKRSKIHVLEALLRLRQAACDPRLVNPDCGVRGTKIENLMKHLSEVIDEGHKVLVFSQFTTLLALLRQDIDSEGWRYEYLDGKTRKRADRVKRFQTDDECPLFLISLKAGGNGLNLTAADYVFILDPWWNPAVEAQAIDRAHRMGQTQSVNAYRMVCTDTVEEKIIELQQSKRELADAIISQEKSLISELTSDDLQALLG